MSSYLKIRSEIKKLYTGDGSGSDGRTGVQRGDYMLVRMLFEEHKKKCVVFIPLFSLSSNMSGGLQNVTLSKIKALIRVLISYKNL